MDIRELEFSTVKQIYTDYLCNDFVPAEQKPLIVIQILMKMGLYQCYGFYEQEQFLGYAFLCEAKPKEARTVLLDYFVIQKEYRSNGYGSKIMKLLKEKMAHYDYLIAEVEQMDVNSNDSDIRKKRLKFYEKNGYHDTNLYVDLFGEELRILILPIKNKSNDEKKIFDELNQIYDKMFYDKSIRERVQLKKMK